MAYGTQRKTLMMWLKELFITKTKITEVLSHFPLLTILKI